MKISFKKLSQRGALSLHTLVPLILVLVAVGGVGAYVISKSSAAAGPIVSGSTNACGSRYSDGVVLNTSYTTRLRDSDSVRNIAYELCNRGKISSKVAKAYARSGKWDAGLQNAVLNYQRSTEPLQEAATGLPNLFTVCSLGLNPSGWSGSCADMWVVSGKL